MATPRPTTSAEGDATGIQISPDVSIPESPPGDKANPPGEPRLTESSMLMQMHEFLGKIVEHLPIGEPVVVGKKRGKVKTTPLSRVFVVAFRGTANNTISKIIPLATVNLLFGGAFDQRIARNKQTMCQATEGRNNTAFGDNEIEGR